MTDRVIKIALIGKCKTGKTSFVRRHVYGAFVEDYIPSEYMSIYTVNRMTNKGSIKLEFHDFPGMDQNVQLPELSSYDGVLFFYRDESVDVVDERGEHHWYEPHVKIPHRKYYENLIATCPTKIVVIWKEDISKWSDSMFRRFDSEWGIKCMYDVSIKENAHLYGPLNHIVRNVLNDSLIYICEAGFPPSGEPKVPKVNKRFNVAVIGIRGTGKTSFICRHTKGSFDKTYTWTYNIGVYPLHLATSGGPVQLNLWDYPGFDFVTETFELPVKFDGILVFVPEVENVAYATGRIGGEVAKLIRECPTVFVRVNMKTIRKDLEDTGIVILEGPKPIVVSTKESTGNAVPIEELLRKMTGDPKLITDPPNAKRGPPKGEYIFIDDTDEEMWKLTHQFIKRLSDFMDKRIGKMENVEQK